jgi:hypothetical protein
MLQGDHNSNREDDQMTKTMPVCAALLLAAGLVSVAGAATAQVTPEVRRACERKAMEVRPILNAPEREAFIANCLADATWSPNTKKGANN